jgi:hypothetical protein
MGPERLNPVKQPIEVATLVAILGLKLNFVWP